VVCEGIAEKKAIKKKTQEEGIKRKVFDLSKKNFRNTPTAEGAGGIKNRRCNFHQIKNEKQGPNGEGEK